MTRYTLRFLVWRRARREINSCPPAQIIPKANMLDAVPAVSGWRPERWCLAISPSLQESTANTEQQLVAELLAARRRLQNANDTKVPTAHTYA